MGTRLAGNVTAGRDSQLVILGADNAVLDPAVATPPAGAAVAVGPLDRPSAAAVAELQALVRAGGVVAAGGSVDLGDGFRSARLPGGADDRRDGIVAALRVVDADRLGDRFAVLVALFGPAATKPVGAAAVQAIAERRFAALALAAAASDVLGPEQLERILALEAPADVDPVGSAAPSAMAAHLSTLFSGVLAKRRPDLLVSLWSLVVARQLARRCTARMLTDQHRSPIEELRADFWALEDALVVNRVQEAFGRSPTLATAARWIPDAAWVRARLTDLLHDAIAATALLRAAKSVAEHGVQTGMKLALDQLRAAAAITLKTGPGKARAEQAEASARPGRAPASPLPYLRELVQRVHPGRVLSVEVSDIVVRRLAHAYDYGMLVLEGAESWIDYVGRLPWDPADLTEDGSLRPLRQWRRTVGYSAVRPPEGWIEHPVLSPPETQALADRMPMLETVGDLLWLADVADAVAQLHGHERAAIDDGEPRFDVDPAEPEADFAALRDDSVPAALAGAAQLIAFGVKAPRTSDWSQFAAGLAADALVTEAFTNPFKVAPVLAERDGAVIPGTDARFEVARNPRQLATWANEMGNCIAGSGYVDYAQSGRSVLAALRAPNGRLLANVEVMPRQKARGWRIEEMRARFNADPSPELVSRFAEWLASLPRPAPAPVEDDLDPVEPRPRSTRRRPAVGGQLSAAATEALSTVAPAVAALSSFGDVRTPLDEVVRCVQQYLADGSSLAELWDVSGIRPLAQAIDALDPALRSAWHHLDRLTVDEPLSGSPLSLARRPPIAAARAVDVFAHRVRRVVGDLAGVDDAALASAVRRTASQRALCALLLTLNTTRHQVPTVAADEPLALPLVDPWRAAWPDAVELGAVEARLTTALRVPRLWLGRGGWPALWHTAAKHGR